MQYRFLFFFRTNVFAAFLTGAFFAAALTSCSDDDDSPDLPPGEEYPLIFAFDEITDETLFL